ncbi:hypothetical protein NC652_005272 [Populus alba x Populus x berolinensis]|nr:hypothetical protein NC652_005272 [Populus alba x Populus x berolinensis]
MYLADNGFNNVKSAFARNEFALDGSLVAQHRPETVKVKWTVPYMSNLCKIFTDTSADGKIIGIDKNLMNRAMAEAVVVRWYLLQSGGKLLQRQDEERFTITILY